MVSSTKEKGGWSVQEDGWWNYARYHVNVSAVPVNTVPLPFEIHFAMRSTLPALPEHPHASTWPAPIPHAFARMNETFTKARNVLDLDDSDPHRLAAHADQLQNHALRIARSMHRQLPGVWVQDVVNLIESLVRALRVAEATARGR